MPPTAVAVIAATALLAGCASASTHAAVPAPTETTPTASPLSAAPTPTPTATRSARPSVRPTHSSRPAAAQPAFTSSVARVSAADLGKSWHPGCPVGPASLRALTVTFWGFDHTAHKGTVIVNASAVSAMTAALRRMYAARFPIRRMVPVSAYGGDDNKSMAADNTSAFNCRYAVSNGPKSWSMHAYGLAIDINTVENPYTLGGKVRPPSGAPYTDRSNVRPGMIVRGSVPVFAFSAAGWGWGGNWSSSPDYQHFSSNGK